MGRFGGACHGAVMGAFGSIVWSSDGAIWGYTIGQNLGNEIT